MSVRRMFRMPNSSSMGPLRQALPASAPAAEFLMLFGLQPSC